MVDRATIRDEDDIYRVKFVFYMGFLTGLHSLTTNLPRWKIWMTQKPILDTSWTTRKVWSTTQGSYTRSCSADVVVSIGLIISCGFVSFCCIAAWVIVTRRRQRAILKRRRQLETQHRPPSSQRSLERRSPVPSNMENITSNPEMNLNVPRSGTYAYGEYGQESIIEGLPPPYTPESLCEPVTRFAPPPYTMGSHSEPFVLVAPPPYSPASPSVHPPPYSMYI
ncbi:hypothetical protein CHS0354_039365 [Potamilus streckersoni]|uniref:Uncharacterized protein n=1 Tax=Potamilus streckersoni TaxID=2493646 RepID=A0AAE0T371_9BIVA|nr:hypothetical protein CHS0354_039365 [Potamilus streckersoni]